MYSSGEVTAEVGRRMYAEFLENSDLFIRSMRRVLAEWPLSCEHFLTNPNINRVAWMGQAAMCIHTGLPRKYRAGFCEMSQQDQRRANADASAMIQRWEHEHRRKGEALHFNMAGEGLWAGHTG